MILFNFFKLMSVRLGNSPYVNIFLGDSYSGQTTLLIKLIHKQIELIHLHQTATLAFILHQQRSNTNILYLQFLSEKNEILHKVIIEKKDGNWRSG